jgi:hypothetical protein
MIELPGKRHETEGGEAWAPPSSAWCQLGIFERARPCSAIPCAVVGPPDSQTATTLLRDDPSPQELELDSDLSTLHLEYLFSHPRR